MEGFAWLLIKIAVLLALAGGAFFALGWWMRGRQSAPVSDASPADVTGRSEAAVHAAESARDAAEEELTAVRSHLQTAETEVRRLLSQQAQHERAESQDDLKSAAHAAVAERDVAVQELTSVRAQLKTAETEMQRLLSLQEQQATAESLEDLKSAARAAEAGRDAAEQELSIVRSQLKAADTEVQRLLNVQEPQRGAEPSENLVLHAEIEEIPKSEPMTKAKAPAKSMSKAKEKSPAEAKPKAKAKPRAKKIKD